MKTLTKITQMNLAGVPLRAWDQLKIRYRAGAKPENAFKRANYKSDDPVLVIPRVDLKTDGHFGEGAFMAAMGYQRMNAARREEFARVQMMAERAAQSWLEDRFGGGSLAFRTLDTAGHDEVNRRLVTVSH